MNLLEHQTRPTVILDSAVEYVVNSRNSYHSMPTLPNIQNVTAQHGALILYKVAPVWMWHVVLFDEGTEKKKYIFVKRYYEKILE